uniref:Uncharacterized protein n=1 Tax=Sinocyclocheilus anshuiensis TaxID=1608454 RepID=A0A671KIE3_9TELE
EREHLFCYDVLSRDSGECSICLDDMVQGDTIWFEVNRSCPEHPTD